MSGGLLKYIISHTEGDVRYILHADTNEDSHLGVALKARVDRLCVIGGGVVAWGGQGFTLRGSSDKFKGEPANIRSAFITLLNERFHDELQRYIESRQTK